MDFYYLFALAVSGIEGPVYKVNHTGWIAVVIPTDHPKSIHDY